MLNRIAQATGTFVPVSSLLLNMLEMKELNVPASGGVGKAVNLLNVKQVDKTTLKTRAFQESCLYCLVEELAEHLTQWSYSVAFYELSFIPLVRLRSFCKSIKADRFRREVKELIRQIEKNIEFTNSRRTTIEISPSDPGAALFLKTEKESGDSPLSKFVANLRLRSQQRNDALVESSVLVGAESSTFGKIPEVDDEDDGDAEEGAAVFSSSWLPEKKKVSKEKKSSKKRSRVMMDNADAEEDVVEDLVLSSEEEEDDDDDDEEEGDDFDNSAVHNSTLEDRDEGTRQQYVKQDHRKQKSAPLDQETKNDKLATDSNKSRKYRRKKAKV